MPSVDSWCLFLDVNGDVGERFSCGRGFHPDPESREPFNHSTWFLSLEICTSWIKSLKSLRLIFITGILHIMNQNQVAYLLYRSCSNYFSSVEHFEPRISIAHVQFFRLQVPFSPKFEADFWPDERLEQASILITVFYFQDLFSWFSFSGKPSERKPLIFGSSFKSPFNLQVLPSIQRFSFNQIFQWIQFFNFARFFLRFFFKFAGNS